MMRTTAIFLVALATMPGAAAAGAFWDGIERTGSSLSYGLNFHDDDDAEPFVENYTQSLVYRMDYALGGDWSLGVSLGYVHETYEADYYSERFSIGFFPSMRVGAGDIGAYFIAGTNTSTPEQEYGIQGSYDFGAVSFEGYAGVFLDDGDAEGTLGAALRYPVLEGLDVYAIHRRDYFDSGFDGLTTLGVAYALSGGDSGPSSLPPLFVSLEASKFHDQGSSLFGSGWQQYSISVSYVFGGDRPSDFRGVRTVDYFYD
ncbi:MAG: hypothetical protein AAFN59_00800 [Pseudomonadota bacterium]